MSGRKQLRLDEPQPHLLVNPRLQQSICQTKLNDQIN